MDDSTSGDLFNLSLSIGVLMAVVAVIITCVILIIRKIGKKVVEVTVAVSQQGKPRFRKRDKVLFYGRKMFRKVKSLSNDQPKSKKMIKFAKRILRIKRGDNEPLQLQVKEPPAAYLEEDMWSEKTEQKFPPEVTYMLKSIRVFGFFEKPLFLELCKLLEARTIVAGNYLFRKGDPDDSIFVLQLGKLHVFITEPDGSEYLLKEVHAGDSIVSLLSFADVLTGHQAPYKTVSARAQMDSTVFRLPVQAFQKILESSPETLVRVVQVIMVRLQRVTFTTLHNYLGLSTQLIKPNDDKKSVMTTYVAPANTVSPKNSPTKHKDSHPLGHEAFTQAVDDSAQDRISKYEQTSTEFQVACMRARASIEESTVIADAGSRKKKKDVHMHKISIADDDYSHYLKAAVNGFKNELNLENDDLLQGRIELQYSPSGMYLMKQSAVEDASLIYVLTGSLNISQKIVNKDEETHLFIASPGEIVGALAVLSGEPSFFNIRVRHPGIVAIISKNHLYEIMRVKPKIVLNVAHSLIQRLSAFVRQIDFSLDWINIEAGRALYRQGDKTDCTYVVLSGRLRSVITHSNGKKELVGEYGRGDLVGIVELITLTERSTTVMAIRDTELAKLPEGLLNAIKIKYPVVVTRLIHLLGHRILGTWQKSGLSPYVEQSVPNVHASRPAGSNFATVAILPASDDVPLSPFALELHHSFSIIGPTLRLTNDIVRKTLGPTILETRNEYRLSSWLAQQEDQHKIVLYQCDMYSSSWTQHCTRQADVILIVAMASSKPSVGKMEKQLESIAVRTQKELILLHNEDDPLPRNTVQWLNMRSWCSSHHHIRCPHRMFAKKSQLRINEMYNKIFENPPNIHSDFSRLARFLTGTSIGLVLGGGGARGAAHVGMIKAIQEAGIPIDIVGGVSIGAFMGALWCSERNLTTFIQRAREWSFKMTSFWRQILDLTYPATAMFTGAAFNKVIEDVFRDIQVEDLWLPYYAVTTDITDSVMRIHTHGSLWRYVRSSMSLSGYLPPLCDPTDGHLLLDGGYVNNLPADVMKNMGVQSILAVDVGSQDETSHTNYGDTLSGWWLLWKRWNPWSEQIKVPSLPEIQSRLAYVSCCRQLEQVKRSDYCEYIRPPIDKYKTLQFGSFDEIMDVGYNHGKDLLNSETVKRLVNHDVSSGDNLLSYQSLCGVRNASFTDLAEMVCRIEEPSRTYFTESSEEEEEEELEEEPKDGYASEPDRVLFSTNEEDNVPVRRRRLMSLDIIDSFSAPET